MDHKINFIYGDIADKIHTIPDHSMSLIYWDTYPTKASDTQGASSAMLDALIVDLLRVAKPNCRMIVHNREPDLSELTFRLRKNFSTMYYWPKGAGQGANGTTIPKTMIVPFAVFTLNPTQSKPPFHPPHHYFDKDGVKHLYTGNMLPAPDERNNFFVVDTPRLNNFDQPVDLLEYFLRTYTAIGDEVLDLFMGSGSMEIACLNTNRKCTGVEINPTRMAHAINRVGDYIDSGELKRRLKFKGVSLS